MSNIVTIIPGLDAPVWPWPFSYLIDLYFKYWGLDAKRDNDWSAFQEYLMSRGINKVIISNRFTRFTNYSIGLIAKKLAETINGISEDKIILFAYSLGGSVAEEAVGLIAEKEKIIKLIYLASPHGKKIINLPESIKLINIYSDADNYLDFANRMLYLKGYKKIDNAENFILSDVKHGQFNKPDLFEYYLQVLTK